MVLQTYSEEHGASSIPVHSLLEIRQILQEHGLAPQTLMTDGGLHRCPTVDKPHGQDGAYIIHLDGEDGLTSVWWHNWRTGDTDTHTIKGAQFTRSAQALTPAEKQIMADRIAASQEQREKERQARHAEAEKRANATWDKASLASDEHPYLQRKGVLSHDLKVTRNNALIIPINNEQSAIQSLQFIPPDGQEKRFLAGGKIQGGFYYLNPKAENINAPLCICEGYATAASVHAATGNGCLVAFNAGNLSAVARVMQHHCPDRTIIICADNDVGAASNVGLEKASAAAREIGAFLAVPPSIDGQSTDFNDLHRAMGLMAVKDCIERATLATDMENIDATPDSFTAWVIQVLNQEQGPYPVEALGDFAPVVHNVAQHVAAPLSMVANSVLATLSLCTQGLANIEHEGRTVVLSLYCLTIAESGDRKSTVDGFINASVREHENDLYVVHKEDMNTWKKDMQAYELVQKSIKKGNDFTRVRADLEMLGDAPTKPINPRLIASNINIEGLYRLFQEGRHSLGLFSDEAGTFLGGASFAQENKLKSISFLSTIWSNGSADKIRLVEGDSRICGKRLASHLMVQPVVAEPLFSDALLQGQGFLPRFLLAWPQSLKGTRLKDELPLYDLREDGAVLHLYARCKELLQCEPNRDVYGEPCFMTLCLDDDAQQIYRELYNATEREQREDGALAKVSTYASRCAEQALRIAGVLTVAMFGHEATAIDGTNMRRGATLALWYLMECKRIIEKCDARELERQITVLRRWLKRNNERLVTTHKMVQYTRLKGTARMLKLLHILQGYGCVKPAPEGTLIDGKKRSNGWEVDLERL